MLMSKRSLAKRLDINMYTHGHTVPGLRRLPGNLLDAVRSFQSSKVLEEKLSRPFVESYAKLKLQELRSYSAQVTPWELVRTLDC
jgi:glutamine synthetase